MSKPTFDSEITKLAIKRLGGGGGNKKNGKEKNVGAPDVKSSNPKDRLSADRLDLSLFPVIARAYGALAMTEGGLKYEPYNWREPGKGIRATVYYAACCRHLDKWLSHEWEDPETGVPHLASALACIGILIDAYETNCVTDDRPRRAFDEHKNIFAGVMDMLTDKARHLHTMFPQAPAPEPSSPPALEKCCDHEACIEPRKRGWRFCAGHLGQVGLPKRREPECKNCEHTHNHHLSNGTCIEYAIPTWDPGDTEDV